MKERYVIKDTISAVDERKKQNWTEGLGKDAKFTENSEGWFITLSSSHISIYVGGEKPNLEVGESVRVTVERAVDPKS